MTFATLDTSGSARIFVSLSVAADVRRTLAKLPKDQFPPMRWVKADQFHITMKFLGTVPKSRIDAVNRAIEKSVSHRLEEIRSGIRLTARGLGAFPTANRAHVLWTGLVGDIVQLRSLQRAIEDELSTQGFPKETRSFKPHITLARSRTEVTLRHPLDQFKDTDFGSWTVEHICVMESQLSPSGPKYIPRHVIPFE